MKKELFIGLMSGTSMDAIDAVVVDFASSPLQLLATHREPIPDEIKLPLHELCLPGPDEINRLGSLDIQVGNLFARACQMLLQKANLHSSDIMAIGSHGQTIRHQPRFQFPFTLQIGDPNIIAESTGITTIADFRRRDMARGGQGAPLVPAFHNEFFRNSKINRVIVNIGGIANITLLPADSSLPITGFDTGPGNTLLDAWTRSHKDQPCDWNGGWARSGILNNSLLETLLSDSYFQQAPPKSTGREYFNLLWLQDKLPNNIAAADVQRTLVEFTACSIINAINRFGHASTAQIILCGGGVHNHFLLERLEYHRGQHSLHSSAEFGIDPDWIEAIAFAWLAKQTLTGKPGNLPTVTGAKQAVILGGIYSVSDKYVK